MDATTAKSLYDLGVTFISTAEAEWWKEGHIPSTVHLPLDRPKDPAKKRFKEATLMDIVGKSEEVVFYTGTIDWIGESAADASAMALTWGFTQVYYFDGGLFAWNKAGFPVETGQ